MTARQLLLPGKPVRIQRSRARGWRMPDNTVYVGRPTKWGNLWKVGLSTCGCRSAGECEHDNWHCETAAEAVKRYRELWEIRLDPKAAPPARLKLRLMDLAALRGKNLACWCALDQPCHADVLLELANAPEVTP